MIAKIVCFIAIWKIVAYNGLLGYERNIIPFYGVHCDFICFVERILE